jgi:NAD(P)-dependent dehydrogenase (short-subunit alcohol dehydrogenase family)
MINALGPYLVTQAFVGGMVDAGWGRIVNVSSAASLHTPGPLNSAYGTSSHGRRGCFPAGRSTL